MSVVYRVTVEHTEYDDEGMSVRSEMLFEAASPSAERLIGYAPNEVLAALETAATLDAAERSPLRVAQGPGDLDELRSAVEANPHGLHVVPEPAGGEEEKPRRKRRTKAEIEADKAAAELATQQQASAAPIPDGPAPAAPAPEPPAAEPPAAPAPAWNPFAK